MQRSTRVLCAAAVLLAILRPAAGEVFLLHSGGRIEGDLLNADENPRTSYVISLPGGGQVTLAADAVDKVQPVRPELVEYEKVRRQHPDTVQGHIQMSDWCRDHGLTAQRKTHMERVLQLDPDQPQARQFLGYRKFKDKWMTIEEEMADKGYVKRDGKWMTEETADLHDRQTKEVKAESEWKGKISRWRQWLDGSKAEQGEKNLRAIDDPMAVPGLAERLRKDRRTDARLMYVEALGRISAREPPGRNDSDKPQARGPLAGCAIDDPVEGVRLSCLDELKQQKDDKVTAYFMARMRDKYTTNAIINRAGLALGQIKDPSSIETLIEYLVTGHDEVIQNPGGPGAMTTTFGTKGTPGGGLAMNQKPTVIRRILQNRDVLDALVAITGQNFGFDQPAWNAWYASQKAKGAPLVKQP